MSIVNRVFSEPCTPMIFCEEIFSRLDSSCEVLHICHNQGKSVRLCCKALAALNWIGSDIFLLLGVAIVE